MSVEHIRCIWGWLKRSAVPLGAAASFTTALGLAVFDKVAAGTLAAGLFVVLVLFSELPKMEAFKAWGIEAKWREKLNEADEAIEGLRKLASASAAATYFLLAWSNRAGDELDTKQKIARLTDNVLNEIGVDPKATQSFKVQYVENHVRDLRDVFLKKWDGIKERLKKEAHWDLEAGRTDQAKYASILLRLDQFSAVRRHEFDTRNAEASLMEMLPLNVIPKADIDVMKEEASRLDRVARECFSEQRLTDEYLRIIAEFDRSGIDLGLGS